METVTETEKGKYVVKLSLAQEQIDDILTTAFEGGISYWCCHADMTRGHVERDPHSPSFYAPEGFRYELYDAEDGRAFGKSDKMAEQPYRDLTAESLLEGIGRFLEEGGSLENIDAGDADSIVQFAVFGELVYG